MLFSFSSRIENKIKSALGNSGVGYGVGVIVGDGVGISVGYGNGLRDTKGVGVVSGFGMGVAAGICLLHRTDKVALSIDNEKLGVLSKYACFDGVRDANDTSK